VLSTPTDLGPFGFKFHQVAIFTNMIEEAVLRFTDLGFEDWTWDQAILKGARLINNQWQPVQTAARMAFNYDVMPMELEFLEYDGLSEHRHKERSQLTVIPFISHMSVHVEDVVRTIMRLRWEYALTPYHVFVTEQHTNPAIVGRQRFVECIFDTRADLGFDIKCIQRLPWDSDLTAEIILGESSLLELEKADV
jgi:hypothetical protein